MDIAIDVDVRMDDADLLNELRHDVLNGLSANPRWLSPRWFYDAEGSRLFDEITRLPEYYLTRSETQILQTYAKDISAIAGPSILVELGSGYSTKTKLILDALQEDQHLKGITTLDVSIDALQEAADLLEKRYTNTPLHQIVGDYSRHLDAIPKAQGSVRRLLVFLGSTVGNLIPSERSDFFNSCSNVLNQGELFLLGTDLIKDTKILEEAYDDSLGVTAKFNLNILNVIKNKLQGEIDISAFNHVASWDKENSWVQISLQANQKTTIKVPNLITADFGIGDSILTEVSSKFTTDQIDEELNVAGFKVVDRWFDSDKFFALTLAERF